MAGGSSRVLPSGTVCFLFADIESSTALLRSLGEARWAPIQAQVQAMVRAAVESTGGVVVNTEGDGAFAAFSSAASAMRAAADAQRQLAAVPWGDVDVRVRMGIHVGSAVQPRDDDYVALAVHQAARVAAAAHGGQVLVTEHVVAETGRTYVTDLGLFSVRDFDGAVRLFELVGDGEKRAPRVPPAFDTQVPRYRLALVGRDAEIADVVERLDSNPLVSLVGPAGVGKTRLAVAVISQVSPQLQAGPWFVDLTEAYEPGAVGEVVAAAVGCPPGADIGVHLDAVLDDRRGVMVLDHCEALRDAARSVVTLLRDWCPTLQVVATSTEPLGIAGEVVCTVGPLPLPASADPGDVLNSPSGRLFVERADAVLESFDMTAHADVVAAVCRAVRGVPLAIELAAAMHEPSAPASLLALLGDGSLTHVIDAAVGQLAATDAAALAALAVAESPIPENIAIAALSAVGVEPDRCANVLDRLVRTSLVRLDPDGQHSLLETVRTRIPRSDEQRRAVTRALLDACVASLDEASSTLARFESVAGTAAMLLREDSLPPGRRQRLAVQLAPWWVARLGEVRARDLLLGALALDTTGAAAAAVHLAVAGTYAPGTETFDTEWHVQRAAVLLGEHDAVDPAMIERLKDMATRARRDESG